MPVPQINLVEAFAIGIPVGIAGYAIQETILRRRASRSTAEPAAPKKADVGPTATGHDAPAQEPTDVTFPLPIPVTRPSRTRPKRPFRASPQPGPAKPAAADEAPPQPVVAAAVEAQVAKPSSQRKSIAPVPPPTAPSPAAAADPAPVTVAAAAEVPSEPSTPSAKARPAAAKALPATADPAAAPKPSKALLKREGDLDAALEAVVDFVDGQPRRARAQACADAIDRLVPKTRRGPAQTRFEAAVKSGTAPGELQEMAESVGIELARALHAVREEIKTDS